MGLMVRLRQQPTGLPKPDDFDVVDVEIPSGEVVVRNKYLVIEPGTRLFIDGAVTGVPGFAVGEGLRGDAVGHVVASNNSRFRVGDTVRHVLGWREYAAGDATDFRPVTGDLRTVMSSGLVGYVGLTDIAELKAGETVWVSSAAGSVGNLAAQTAQLLGATVIASAGSAEKVKILRDQGFGAFDYHDGPIVDRIRELAPDGIDVYFDNVGGDHLAAALDVLRPHGRVVLCGAMAQQGADEVPPGPRNLLQIIAKRLTLKGFTVNEHFAQAPAFAELAGRLRLRQNIVTGVAAIPEAFCGLLRGEYTGQVLVQVY
jgi:NADPH-dependent curcumin reductase CurA